ncbi:MAG: hypothetical protein ABH824_02880 [Nanoarchaeota archaeon]|nr:hypothetical protein [Nanoarchaeota archaeon]MBU1632079.1 hypothetical protein [Nanoarchaeota archaeon]MBU1875713.1 hypothetical protein [Nanoarchaeota archaeon]
MKILFFDTGPIITLVMSRLIWILPKLKEKYGGKFYITPAVKRELIERPMTIKRFEFEALQSLKLIEDGVLEVYDKVPQKKVNELINLANSSFKIKSKNLDIIQSGEMEIVACALETNADAIIMDERTLRLFIENNKEMEKLLEIRFKKDVVADRERMDKFSQQLKGTKILRSIELVSTAYKMGLLDQYIPKLKGGREILIDSVLWTTKYNGCAVTQHEIEEIKNYLLADK